MDWTFWLLGVCAGLGILGALWWVLDAYGFLSEGWDEHIGGWGDE